MYVGKEFAGVAFKVSADKIFNFLNLKFKKIFSSLFRCAHKQNCSVLASTNMFGDPCPGTHKYLEAHYQCVSGKQNVNIC